MKKRGKRRGKKAEVAMLPVPYEKGTELPVAMNEAQRNILACRTPTHEIFWRTIRGGQKAPYVQGNYVVDQLNRAFGHDWDVLVDRETDEKTAIEIGQIVCRGRLIVRVGPRTIIKSAAGGSAVKKSKGSILDLGDDYKAAETDMLKKAASKIGIALDVYRWKGDDGKVKKPEGDESPEMKDVNPRPAEPAADDADKKRIANKLTILNQTWLRLQKLLPQTYTEARWAELWREYKTATGKKNFPTQESQIDDLTSLLSIDLQEHMKGGKK